MPWQFNPYSLFLIVTAALAAGLVVACWRRRPLPGAAAFSVVMLALLVWSLAYGMALAHSTPEVKERLIRLQYLGVVTAPIAWFLFALGYTRQDLWLSPRIYILLAVEPLLFLLLLATNDSHALVYEGVILTDMGSFSTLQWDEVGWAFWMHSVYSYGLLTVTSYLIIRAFILSPGLYQGQILLLIVAAFAPWIGNALYLFGVSPYVDPTSFAFLLTGILVTLALYRFRLLDIVPVARHAVMEDLSDGIIVLDSRNRVVDLNPAAEEMIGVSAGEAIGQRGMHVLAAWPQLVDKYRERKHAHDEILVERQGEVRAYDLRISPLRRGGGRIEGRLVGLRDITERKLAEEALRTREHFLASLSEITEAALETPDLQTMVQTLADRLGELFGADGCYLVLWDEERRQPRPAAALDIPQEVYRTRTMEIGEVALISKTLAEERPLVIEDTTRISYLVERETPLFPGHSLLGLPLIADGRKLGAAIIAFERPRSFKAEEVAQAGQVSRHLALALAKVKMLDSERFARERTEALYQFTSSLLTHEDLTQALQTVAREMAELLLADRVLIVTLDLEGRRILKAVLEGRGATPLVPFSFEELEEGLVGWVLREREATLSPKGRPDARESAAVRRRRAEFKLGALMVAPLRYRGRSLGAVVAINRLQDPDFTEHDLALLAAVSNQAAVVIDDIRLYEETARLKVFNENILQSVGEIILLEDENGRFTFVNPAIEEVLGYVPESLLGQSWELLLPKREWARVREESRRREQGLAGRYETLACASDGREVPLIVSARPLFQEGRFAGTISAVTDITERKRVEEEREQLIEDLDAFAHTVAHDLKTPLTLIVGAARLLQKNIDLENRTLHYLTDSVVRGGNKMSNIIDELLLLSSVREKADITFETLQMDAIVAESLDRLQGLIEERGAQIQLPESWPVARGYGPWVEEIWANYISNAIKYGGDPPVVELGGSLCNGEGAAGARSYARFWVRDNGKGISEEERQRLFTPFTRLGQVNVSGHGLGLSIVQRIVQRLNGQVEVRSEPGVGAEFSFILPADEAVLSR